VKNKVPTVLMLLLSFHSSSLSDLRFLLVVVIVVDVVVVVVYPLLFLLHYHFLPHCHQTTKQYIPTQKVSWIGRYDTLCVSSFFNFWIVCSDVLLHNKSG